MPCPAPVTRATLFLKLMTIVLYSEWATVNIKHAFISDTTHHHSPLPIHPVNANLLQLRFLNRLSKNPCQRPNAPVPHAFDTNKHNHADEPSQFVSIQPSERPILLLKPLIAMSFYAHRG